jgi:hypothetical protein
MFCCGCTPRSKYQPPTPKQAKIATTAPIMIQRSMMFPPQLQHSPAAPPVPPARPIAKEGRKYGVSLALVTQRPSEPDPTILSQCSTAMRLAIEVDRRVMRADVHGSAFGILEYLPLLAGREAIMLGHAHHGPPSAGRNRRLLARPEPPLKTAKRPHRGNPRIFTAVCNKPHASSNPC